MEAHELSFPKSVLEETENIELNKENFKFRNRTLGISIDIPESELAEVAFWVYENPDRYIVSISLSDPSEFVPVGSLTDQEAFLRRQTDFANNVEAPLLPPNVSEELLALTPDERKPTITINIPILKKDFSVNEPSFSKTYLQTGARLNYFTAEKGFSDPELTFNKMLNQAFKVAERLNHQRKSRRLLKKLDFFETWSASKGSQLRSFMQIASTKSYFVLQELLLLANTSVADFCAKYGIPVIYKNYNGVSKLPVKKLAAELSEVMDRLPASQIEQIRHLVKINAQAYFSPSNIGNRRLGVRQYLKVTSPLRRYVDLVNLRVVNALASQEEFPYTCCELRLLCKHLNGDARIKDIREFIQSQCVDPVTCLV
ncbi:RNB domain-containing ribonuclease [Candidatus Peregrinibacteria bacterium]|nr:RNB domain-containing ribonuclease [Candidatus Peregrinibacteria bacterium]